MKTFFNPYALYIGLTAAVFSASCAPEIEHAMPNNQSKADFSKYIAIGNSLTSGFADGGLYLEGQKIAFPNLIAEQMKPFGGGEFNSPLFSQEQANGSGYLRLTALVNGNPVIGPVTDKLAIRGLSPTNTPLYTKYTGAEIQNLGIPGMRMDLAFVPGVGSVVGNPYFERLLPNETSTTTYFDYTTTKNHTFFSFWLGNNDVLGYASNGAYENPGDPMTRFTPEAQFKTRLSEYITALTIKDQKGVIATIPDVTAIPFFNTVTTARLEAGVSASTQGQFSKIYIRTAAGVRQATNEDLFTLQFPTDTLGKAVVPGNPLTAGYGLIEQNPLHDKFVLDKDEIIEVNTRIAAFNREIKSIAKSNDLAVADVNAFLNKLKQGYTYNGITINNKFITGNAFSLDGIHLTPIGYAITANLFIEAINAKYRSSLQKVDVTKFRGVVMP